MGLLSTFNLTTFCTIGDGSGLWMSSQVQTCMSGSQTQRWKRFGELRLELGVHLFGDIVSGLDILIGLLGFLLKPRIGKSRF